ncbi:MAG: flagellar motor protein MotB [Thermodesulfobacteriota bacterium]
MESNKKLTVIIKKKKKGGAGGHHGGSWKVAYADFVTAMMAFFLLMWLLSSVPQEKKEEIAYYFKHFSLFEDGSGTRQQLGISTQESAPQITIEPIPPVGESDAAEQAEDLKEQLEKEISERMESLKDQVTITLFQGGVKVDIMDKVGTPMFALGSTELTDDGKKLIALISENIKETKYQVEIEGHTDAVTYSTRQYGNWELSTARASAARVALEKNGLDAARLIRVSGYAATQPVIKENPYDPRNRRISLRLYPEETKGGAPPPKPQQP